MKTIVQIENMTKTELIELIVKNRPEKEKAYLDEELMTSKELALYLDVTQQTLIRWRQQGIIPFYGNGKTILHKKSEIMAALRQNPKLNK
ncbi:MAG: helix-turn-helix domain-containing protein [Tenuifilaceae bacterium]|nr:helix-turn-helix domain-containing protein [Tenuifilaceae bacterium]